MATASHLSPAALAETFQKPAFSKEVEGWLGRATPADRERFERVFESIRSIAEAKKAPNAHGQFVESTLSKMKQRSVSASVSRTIPTPPLPRGSPAVVCNGWSYTATRAAFETKPDTRKSLLALQDMAAAQHEHELQAQQRELELDFKQAERPATAPSSNPGVASSDRDLSALQQAAERRRALSFGVGGASGSSCDSAGAAAGSVAAAAAAATTAAADAAAAAIASVCAPPVGGTGSGHGAGFVPISPHSTRYQETYNLRSAYPEIYDQALRDTRVEPVPNQTFTSAWGDSLKSHSDDAAKMYWKTTYNTVNDEVVKLKTDADVTREREFFKWMQRQKTFFGDLLSTSKAKDLNEVLAAASDEQKREIREAMRTVHAAMDSTFDRTRSHSQAVHCDMRRVEDEKLEALMREHTKVRTMGQPLTQTHRSAPKRRPATASGASAASGATELKPAMVNLTIGGDRAGAGGDGGANGGSEAGGKALKPSRRPATAAAVLRTSRTSVPPPQRKDVDKMETFRSKLPLTWPTGATGPNISHYAETFGGAKIGAGKVRPNSALFKAQPVKYTDTTVPYGAVNPYTAAVPVHAAYPVPESFVSSGAIQFPQPQGFTTYRNEFAARDPGDVAAQMRASAGLVENSRRLLERGTIPLGPRTGLNVLPSANWISETKDQFVQYDVDPKEPFERAKAMKAMFMAPTGTGGKMTLGPRASSGRGA